MLLLTRDAARWWDRLPSKDSLSEPFLNGYATSGPVRLPALHEAVADRNSAYQRALHAFAEKLGVAAPKVIPDLEAEHFGRPLYLQMAALLALHGERPTTAEGLTKALLNHEVRYWRGLLNPFGCADPERLAAQLLALATLAGGFATPREARPYWETATASSLSRSDFETFFHTLAPLYPGRQGLQAGRVPIARGAASRRPSLGLRDGSPSRRSWASRAQQDLRDCKRHRDGPTTDPRLPPEQAQI